MYKYANLSGNSDIDSYELGEEWIKIRYIDGAIFKYSYHYAGKEIVEHMKILAKEGLGLSKFVAKSAKYLYDH